MAVAFDNATVNEGNGNRVFNHTITGADVGLIVVVGNGDGESLVVTAVTYNGVALTLVREDQNPNQANSEIWQLAAPATGTNQVVVTTASQVVTAVAVSFTGTNQTTLVANHNGATGNSATASVTVTSAAGRMLCDILTIRRGGGVVGAGQTERARSVETRSEIMVSTEPGASPNVVMSWTSVNDQFAISAVDIDDAAAPAPSDQNAPLLGANF